jgi:hypothetical protein
VPSVIPALPRKPKKLGLCVLCGGKKQKEPLRPLCIPLCALR